jgi:hypothetical protein
MTELPVLERELLAAARRRRRRRRRAAVAPVPLLLLLVVALGIGAARLARPQASDEREATPTPAWTTTTNAAHGFTVTLPPGWALARESLTPHLLDPREVFSAGTFPLPYDAGGCAHTPYVPGIGRAGAFVSVEERGRGAKFPPRPADFAAAATPTQGDFAECLGRPVQEFLMEFSDAGRAFHALVALGPDVSAQRRAEAFAILDRLRFDPAVQPTWTASP